MQGKKYQVFVSSTFVDLKDQRQAVSRAILNLGHIPAGMELFPAADVDQMAFIKKVIDDCDYYILIIGGRYGSISDSGLSFTEMEYHYAVERQKPVLAFIHKDVKELKAKDVDAAPELVDKLEAFKRTVSQGRLIEYWDSVESLESKALIALTNAFNEQPQTGWRRDTGELSQEAQQRMDRLRERYEFFREQLERQRRISIDLSEKIKAYESLAEAKIEIRYASHQNGAVSFEMTAEEIIREFATGIRNGISTEEVRLGLQEYIRHKMDESIQDVAPISLQNVLLFLEVFEICSVESGLYVLSGDKKWLLKAAFKPLTKVIAEADDIPF